MSKRHICRYCGKRTENFMRVKRIVYYRKFFQCEPECSSHTLHRRMMVDCRRMEMNIAKQLAAPSPWISLLP